MKEETEDDLSRLVCLGLVLPRAPARFKTTTKEKKREKYQKDGHFVLLKLSWDKRGGGISFASVYL
jgi:hypothetical protein